MNSEIVDSKFSNKYYLETKKKIVPSHKELVKIIKTEHKNKNIVLVKGVYDLFHAGHYYSFLKAKDYGDILIVAVSSDQATRKRKGNGRPIINEYERMILIASMHCVDYVIIYDEESPYHILKKIQPDIFIASHYNSFSEEEFQEIQETTNISFQICKKSGKESTTSIIRKILEAHCYEK